MKNITIVQHQQRIEYLFKRVAAFSGDAELQAYWAQYLCVLTSGFIENSVRHLFIEYARARSVPYVANFVGSELRSFQNAKSEKILELARTFNSDWETSLRDYMKDKRKDAIDSVVSTRHLIAHGRPVGITYTRVFDYYKSVTEVIEFIERLLQ